MTTKNITNAANSFQRVVFHGKWLAGTWEFLGDLVSLVKTNCAGVLFVCHEYLSAKNWTETMSSF